MEKKNSKSRIKIIIFALVMFVLGVSLVFNSQIDIGLKRLYKAVGVNITKDKLVVRYLSVGQGDAVAVNMPNGQIMVIDCGPKTSTNIFVNYIKHSILKDATDNDIDYLIITHPDIDHSGGASALFEEFNVKNFYRPNVASVDESGFGITCETEEYAELIKKSKQKDCNVHIVNQNYFFNIGEVEVKIFAPLKVYDDTNQMSCMVKLTCFEHSFLFTGDLQGDAEQDMLEAYKGDLSADVLKVAHHGSYNATSQPFIDYVQPKYAVICVGNNTYGHPSTQVFNRLSEAGVQVMRTDYGEVGFEADKYSLSVMDTSLITSRIFIEWWKIVLALEILLCVGVVVEIVKVKRFNRKVTH